MAHNELKYRARLTKDFGDVSMVKGSDGRLSQVFLNLLINATHAIDEGNIAGNEVSIKTWPDGDSVIAEVRDTGRGIPDEILRRLFEPFFTTKGPGEGTGLGLSICRKLMESFGGSIEVSSSSAKGTTFSLKFPLTQE